MSIPVHHRESLFNGELPSPPALDSDVGCDCLTDTVLVLHHRQSTPIPEHKVLQDIRLSVMLTQDKFIEAKNST